MYRTIVNKFIPGIELTFDSSSCVNCDDAGLFCDKTAATLIKTIDRLF
jgi:hypothetical protein